MAKIYYGTTLHGTRIHFGSEVLYPDPGNQREWVVVSRCGNRMYSHDPNQPSPGRVIEFCRTCFRAIAWATYVQTLQETAALHGEEIKREEPKRHLRSVS